MSKLSNQTSLNTKDEAIQTVRKPSVVEAKELGKTALYEGIPYSKIQKGKTLESLTLVSAADLVTVGSVVRGTGYITEDAGTVYINFLSSNGERKMSSISLGTVSANQSLLKIQGTPLALDIRITGHTKAVDVLSAIPSHTFSAKVVGILHKPLINPDKPELVKTAFKITGVFKGIETGSNAFTPAYVFQAEN